MHFASDNTGPVHPAIMDALMRANDGYAPSYATDALNESVTGKVREIFEVPDAEVHLVATGTAANSLLLASHVTPWQTVFCSEIAHIHLDELNAPEFFSGGARLTPICAKAGKIQPKHLRERMQESLACDLHAPECGPLSLTQVTELGTVYSLDEIKELTAIAAEAGLKTHMDGARFANALAALGCSPAEMTWKSGIDMVSFGGTKNGLMGVEAAILFDPAKSREFELRRKRGGHLFSKARYLAAQMDAYLTDGLWLDLARRANAAAAGIVEVLQGIPDASFPNPPQANVVFADLPRRLHRALVRGGVEYHLIEGALDGGSEDETLLARFVADWSTRDDDIDRFADILNRA